MFPRKAFGYLLRSGAGVTTLGAAGIVSVGGHNNVLADVGAGEKSNTAQPQSDAITHDIGIIGGGIVGLAVAREFKLRHPEKSMVLLEKEDELATAQTGHNSGVIHAGMYYKPGSMKAELCVEGARRTYDYCREKGIPFRQVGKLIVAVDESEIANLKIIYDRAVENKVVGVEWLDTPEAIQEVESHCAGLKAVLCRSTGIVDWQRVAKEYAGDFTEARGVILLNHKVTDIAKEKPSIASTASRECGNGDCGVITIASRDMPPVRVRHLVTCGGMYSDRLSAMTGGSSIPKMIPFRGEYLLLNPDKAHLIIGNIYPVPNPNFPFLGVHFTPRLNGDVWLGPNAILGFSREGYSYGDINFADLLEILTFQGMIKVVLKHGIFGMSEMYKSLVISAQVKQLQRYIPELRVEDVTRGPSGVRAQAVYSDGTLAEDFIFDEGQRNVLHVRNAPSPGATSSLAIGRLIVDRAESLFGLSKP